jgi:ankyrin repeat protein
MLYYRQLIDINSVDSKGSTALHWASYMGSQQVVEYLLSQPDIKMDEKDGEGSTALHLATYYGNGNIVRMLLIKGADWSI